MTPSGSYATRFVEQLVARERHDARWHLARIRNAVFDLIPPLYWVNTAADKIETDTIVRFGRGGVYGAAKVRT